MSVGESLGSHSRIILTASYKFSRSQFLFDPQAEAFETFEHVEAIQFEVHGTRETYKKGWQTASWQHLKRFAS